MDDGSESPSGGLLDEWLTQPELAAELGVSTVTLRRWGIPSLRLGNRMFYRRDAVRDWLRSQERSEDVSEQRGKRQC